MATYQFQQELRHGGLNKYKVIKAENEYILQQKVSAQLDAWDEMWNKKLEAEKKKKEREEKAKDKQQKLDSAKEQTIEAEEAIKTLENTLIHTLSVDDRIDWDSLLDNKPFGKPSPTRPPIKQLSPEPKIEDEKYHPRYDFLDKILSKRKISKEEAAVQQFQTDHERWLINRESIASINAREKEDYDQQVKKWEDDKKTFEKKQKETNQAVDAMKQRYQNSEKAAIAEYCEMVLNNSDYPDYFPQNFDLDYNSDTKIIVTNYFLPDKDKLPRIKSIKYVQSKDEFVESYLSDAAINKLYDSLIYQISLRTIHELYEADTVNAIDAIVFNGWVESTDKATGNKVTACILSVQANRDDFLAINLENVDPKMCFKNLKGIGSSKLHSLTPIAPILDINKDDSRFVSSYDVSDQLDESYNLAAMDWEDFEHLIREMFEKEFAQNGGEVKITRASRDGGVDAVAFDPDPIRGGKIVIQAKRYTNTVGVSAVRDLYGTVVNEGAIKGILVTTADFGPDAYKFSQDKPITLLSGNNLLHLLEKHGRKAKIDLKEAKQIIAEKEKDK